MKVYVTGGTGFVGSHLSHKLAWAGHEVTLGGLSTDSPIELPEDAEIERIDVTDPDTLDFEGFDAVIHLVGLSPLFKPNVSYHRIHVEGTENVLQACREAGVNRYIHMSALGADPGAETQYLWTKGEAEDAVKNSGLDWTVFRPSVIFGEGGEFLNFTESILTPFIAALPRSNPGFQPLYVEDIGDLFVEAVEDEKHIRQSYDLGGPEAYSLKEIAEMIEASKGRNLTALPLPMTMVKAGMTLSDKLGLKFGMDQYRSLKKDNIPDKNDVDAFRKNVEKMKNLEQYLGLE
ncbi:MAG: complex I NDUFA9 subunit family protein [Candidatus Nanohaloarchaea archaeon]